MDLSGFILLSFPPRSSVLALIAWSSAGGRVPCHHSSGEQLHARAEVCPLSCSAGFCLVCFSTPCSICLFYLSTFFLTSLIKPVWQYRKLDRATYSSSGPVQCSIQFLYLLVDICLAASSTLNDSDFTAFLNSKCVHCKCWCYLQKASYCLSLTEM